MKVTYRFSYSQFFLFFIVITFLSSCVTQKQVKYLQKAQEGDTASVFRNIRAADYKIQTNDNLYIKIYSVMDEKSYSFFNKQSSTYTNDYYNDASIYLNSYSVDDSGYISFPMVGKLFVRDLMVEQAKTLIQSMVNEFLKEASVSVKLVNFKVTVVGEVMQPREFTIYQEKINIFEIISQAGDLTDFADRSKIAIIRQTATGSKVVYLDLNSQKILTSEYYYLRPNDIIYVSPLGIKRWGFTTFPWMLVFTGVTTALLLLNYFKP